MTGALKDGWRSKPSSVSGVYGRLEEVREVAEESSGPGVEPGDEGNMGGGVMGGGVTETDRWPEVIWMAGRTWKDGILPLRLALLNVAAKWPKIVETEDTGPCPLRFKRGEVQRLMQQRER